MNSSKSDQPLEIILNSALDAVIVIQSDGTVAEWNGVAESTFGWSRQEALGALLADLVIPNRFRDAHAKGLENYLKTGSGPILRQRIEVTARRRSGEEFPVELSVSPWLNDGTVCFLGFLRDITARKLAEKVLEESQREFQTLADLVPQLVWMAKPDGHIFWYNQRWYEYTASTPDQMAGWGWQSVHDPQTLPSVLERWKSSLASGEPFEMVFPLKGGDGVFRHFLTRVAPFRDELGRIIRWFGTNTDISQQKQHEEHLNFLMHEMSHRSKNLLAVIQSIIRQLARGSADVPEYISRISERLQGLASTHDQLVENNWQGATLERLILNQVSHFIGEGRLLEVNGPEIRMKPKAAEALGLAFHELATNAAKYGALSHAEGKVHVHWNLALNKSGERMLHLTWRELGGPLVASPLDNGFGSTVLKRVVPETLRGNASLAFLKDGVCWAIECAALDVIE